MPCSWFYATRLAAVLVNCNAIETKVLGEHPHKTYKTAVAALPSGSKLPRHGYSVRP